MKKDLEKDITHFIHDYGDMIFDVCHSLIRDPNHAQILFREILQKLRTRRKQEAYSTYERAWILRIVCETLINQQSHYTELTTPEERIQLDAQTSAAKIEHFKTYFNRLEPIDQLLLLFRDKFALPYSDIASALATPEGSLKMRRQQALRTMEEWLWNGK
jgi:DNA-directed RNA polymerase specialized sigma24 family protein